MSEAGCPVGCMAVGMQGGRTFVLPKPSRVAVLLGVVIVVLGFLHVAGFWLEEAFDIEFVRSRFDLEAERNVPTWFSSTQLLLSSVALAAVARIDQRHAVRRMAAVIAPFLLFFSLDEAAVLHETVTGILGRFEWLPRIGGAHGIWIFLYLGAALVASPWALPGLAELWRGTRRHALGLVVGAAVYVAGGIGVEIFEYFERGNVLVEETLEMAGIALILVTALSMVQHVEIRAGFAGTYPVSAGASEERVVER